ncbi:MAG: phage tail tape measure protein [Clostridia bacterium]|nr:phage tail tape measure protein [Clostridia bacterium]
MATVSTTLTLIDNVSKKLETIRGNVSGLVDGFGGVDTAIGESEKKLNGMSLSGFSTWADNVGTKLTELGSKMQYTLSLPTALLGGKMYGAATDYETAWTGVRKTVEMTDAQASKMYDTLLGISEVMPAENGFVQLAGTAQTAGQLGVAADELAGFTKAYTALETATNIQGEGGATDLARFLNLTEGTTRNIDRVGGVIVELGNNFATTESEILSMGTRMAATAELAGFSAPEIMALSAALTSVGINAEAGGSAAGKLMKSMQGAAEVGVQAQGIFGGQYGSAVDFSYFISDSANLLAVAKELGQTEEYVQSMADAWLNLENFAEISGKTAQQFAADWANNPAQGMLDFFAGLGELDASGQESALAALERMGITEIRLSNLVAAMAGRSDMYRNALAMAYAAYAEDIESNALWSEFGMFAGTQESQNQMLQNKAMNTMADLGDNVAEAAQPILDYANRLLDIFNSLSEVDQDRIAKLMGVLVFAPSAISGFGKIATGVGKIAEGFAKLEKIGLSKIVENVSGFVGMPLGEFAAIATAATTLATAIASIPTDLEKLNERAMNIELSFDQASVDAALAQIAEVQAAVDLLSGGEMTQEMQGYSAAVSAGFGTESMYAQALAYESAAVNDAINRASADYGARLAAQETAIARAQGEEERAALLDEYYDMQAEMEGILADLRADYAQTVSNLFGGMVQQMYPDYADALIRSAEAYDAMQIAYDVLGFKQSDYANFDEAYAAQEAMARELYETGRAVGLIDLAAYDSFERWDWQGNTKDMATALATFLGNSMVDAQEMIANNPAISGWLQTIVQNPAMLENLDFAAISGTFEGVVKALDLSQAIKAGGGIEEAGAYITDGLAGGAVDNAPALTSAMYTLRDATVDAIRAAYEINSPSALMARYGVYLPAGVGEGVRQGETMLTAAIAAVCGAGVSAAAAILSTASGSVIGVQFANGMIQGINSRRGAVIAAARSVANAAAAAMRSALDIHSPSGVTEELGGYFGQGFANGIDESVRDVQQAVGRLSGMAYHEMNRAVWDEISLFSGLETEQLLNDDGEIHLSDGDIRAMRDLAEREVVNRLTTAELHIDFTANNNINSNMDLDGVVSYLEEQLTERLEMAAEGVYS